MKTFKVVIYVVLTIVAIWSIEIWYNSFVPGRPWLHNAFYVTIVQLLIPAAIIAAYIFLIKKIKRSNFIGLFVLMAFSLSLAGSMQSCTYAKNNQIVVYSEDCGVTWTQVKSGDRVPTGTANPCFIKETMPGYAMQGSLEYYVLYKDQVKVKMYCSYDYEIFDPLLFMKEAKTLGKSNANADEAAIDNEKFESAENRVIDVRIKKITSDQFKNEDVVSHDINALEDNYINLINELLKSRGVRLTILELVPDFQEQTKLAIDAANADRIYSAKNMSEFGRQVMLQRAGATNIVVNNNYIPEDDTEQTEKK